MDELLYQLAEDGGATATDKSKLKFINKYTGLKNPTKEQLQNYLHRNGMSVNQLDQLAGQSAVTRQQQFALSSSGFDLLSERAQVQPLPASAGMLSYIIPNTQT